MWAQSYVGAPSGWESASLGARTSSSVTRLHAGSTDVLVRDDGPGRTPNYRLLPPAHCTDEDVRAPGEAPRRD